MSRYNSTERLAVNDVEKIILSELKWLFREQTILDFGIDGQIEIAKKGNPINKLIGVQIKGGSQLTKGKGKYLTFYINSTHYFYWTNSSIPVIGVFKNEEGKYLWQKLDKETIEPTKTRYKVKVPLENIFDKSCIPQIIAYQKEWFPSNEYPLLESKNKTLLGIENFLITIQSLRVIKDSINYHQLNYSIGKFSASKETKLEEISFSDQVTLQKIKLSVTFLKTRIRSELQYFTSISSEFFRAYTAKIISLESQLNNSSISDDDIKKEAKLSGDAEKIVIEMIDEIINKLKQESVTNSVHEVLDSEYQYLNQLIKQLEKELLIVKAFYKMITQAIIELILK